MLERYLIKANENLLAGFDSFRGKTSLHGKNPIFTYWYRGTRNFGDELTPAILKKFGFTPLYTQKNNADLLFIGSILNGLQNDFDGIIFGSGLQKDIVLNLPGAEVIAVRGALTRDHIGAPDETFLGDPGLLAPMLINTDVQKEYVLGVVPHFLDKEDAFIKELKQRYPLEVKIIDVQRKPEKTIVDIASCEHILSSSLHGLITADSLNIPNAWVQLSGRRVGGDFKFQDYGSSIGRVYEPVPLRLPDDLNQMLNLTVSPNDKIQEKIHTLKKMLKNLLSRLTGNGR